MKTKMIEQPVVSIDEIYNDERVLVIHSNINHNGKMILNKEEASLLWLELYKFINKDYENNISNYTRTNH
jgi:hypothetical protein